MTIFVEMVQKCRLRQGFCQNHARTSYSWSPVPGRAGFSSAHWILWAKPKQWQACPTWGLFSGFAALGPHCIYIYIYSTSRRIPRLRWVGVWLVCFWGPSIPNLRRCDWMFRNGISGQIVPQQFLNLNVSAIWGGFSLLNYMFFLGGQPAGIGRYNLPRYL